jgi:hypothetical protein
MNKKNIILVISLVGSFIAYLIFVSNTINICDIYCGSTLGEYHNVFLFFPFILFFSLITYKLPDQVFQSWWKFARIATPAILTLSFIINLELHHKPAGELQAILDFPALVLLYSIFTMGSIWQIWKGYKQRS